MQEIKGIPAAPGIAIGPGYFHKTTQYVPERTLIQNAQTEMLRLEDAIVISEKELVDIYLATQLATGEEVAEIFETHRIMLRDPDFLEEIKNKITSELINAEAAVYEASEVFAQTLQALPNEYLQARAADVRDVSARLIRNLRSEDEEPARLEIPSIIFSEDLTPSDTVQFESEKLLGFVTRKGSATSHTAILSRALGLPAIVGAEKMPNFTSIGAASLILDGFGGRLIIDPDHATLSKYQKLQDKYQKQYVEEQAASSRPAITRDGKKVDVVANIGNLSDAKMSIRNGAEGAGLFRTEFSYLEHSIIPVEDDLIAIYSQIFRTFGDLPIVVRTLDIGGDKEIPYLNLPPELNPFLGNRGIRLCLSRPDLFKPQLRAILRAGKDSNLFIMFPMIAQVQELDEAKKVLTECLNELKRDGAEYNKDPKVGIMIEVPSAAIFADQFAKRVDFFSIGTNDLTQYLFAADRTNTKVADLATGLQPSTIRIIKQIIDHGHNAGIWVGMCGEMAGDPTAIPILLGLGLDEFSMNPPAIPKAKTIIRNWDSQNASILADKALQCETAEEIQTLVDNWRRDS